MATPRRPNKFPLRLHATGQWTKRIRRKQYYFGKDRDAALKEYVRVVDDLQAGRTPRPKQDDGLTVRDLCNTYLTARRRDVDSGELGSRSWGDYLKTCERLVAEFGPGRMVDDLRAEDFAKLKAKVAKRLGPISIGKAVQFTRTIFRFAYETGLIERPIRYGNLFDRPPKRVIRLAKEKAGEKLIEAAAVLAMIDAAEPQLRAMLLLGLNCAFGQGDCSGLNRAQFKKRPGWISAARHKTGIARRCPLWLETIAALDAVMAIRPAPRDDVDQDAVFLTRQGVRWVRWIDAGETKVGTRRDSAAEAFNRLTKQLGLTVPGGPYVLRHVPHRRGRTARPGGDRSRDGPRRPHDGGKLSRADRRRPATGRDEPRQGVAVRPAGYSPG